MASTRELLNKVKLRAWALVIASNGEIDYREAEKAAARSIRDEERQRKRNAAAQSCAAAQPSMEGVTVSNARKFLYDRLAEIASRLKASVHIAEQPPPQFKKHTLDEIASPSLKEAAAPPIKQSEPEPSPPPDQLIGGMIFGTISTSERIDDREFHTSVQSPTTQNWRKSIEAAEKRTRTRWIG
jgi:hypothetical protein